MNLKGSFGIKYPKGEEIGKELQKPGNWQVKYIGPKAEKVTLGKVKVEAV